MSVSYSVIINLINTILLFYLPAVHIFSSKKGNKYTNWIGNSLVFCLWVISARFILSFHSVFWVFIVNVVLMWILYRVTYRDSWKRRLAVVCFSFAIGVVSDTISVLYIRGIIPAVIRMYFQAQNEDMTNLFQLIGNLCFEMVYMVAASVYLCLFQKREKKLFLAFMLIPLYQLVLVTGFFALCHDFTDRVAGTGLAIGVFNTVLDIAMLQFLGSILQKQDIEAQMEALEETRRQEYTYFETVTRGMEELRMIRHDFSNQLQAVYKMADESENMVTVKRMLEEMGRRICQQGGE